MNVKILLSLALSFALSPTYADFLVDAGFKKIESLVGQWQGTLPDGNFIEISYEALNGGAILEVYHSKDPMWWNMSTVYHKGSDRILMNHYCSWGNHPKMEAELNTEKIGESDLLVSELGTKEIETLEFNFIDLVRTKTDKGYMHHLKFSFQDRDHLTHQWTWRENNKDTPLKLTLVRKKDN